MSAEEFVSFTEDFAASGVRLFGGCCGTDETHIAALAARVSGLGLSPFIPQEEESDSIPCASERMVSFIEPEIDVGEPIICSPELAEDILEAEEEPTGAIKIHIGSEDDLYTFEQNQYMINQALCLCSDSEELFEKGLRVFNGRAFYDGSCGFEKSFLDRMSDKYGLVQL
jgi:5-methyltetrahydrofolate--homocysteine methyltransferase